jgi:hypothetical protein
MSTFIPKGSNPQPGVAKFVAGALLVANSWKSRRRRCLIESATMLLPPVGGEV